MCEKIEPCETTRPPNPTLKAETGVRIPLGPPFDARGKLSGESFPRLLMAGHLRLESRFSRVEWCPLKKAGDRKLYILPSVAFRRPSSYSSTVI